MNLTRFFETAQITLGLSCLVSGAETHRMGYNSDIAVCTECLNTDLPLPGAVVVEACQKTSAQKASIDYHRCQPT